MSEPKLLDVKHVASYKVDAQPLLEAFGLTMGAGVISLNLKIEAVDLVEITVRRYVTPAELAALQEALQKEPKPELLDVTAVAVIDTTYHAK